MIRAHELADESDWVDESRGFMSKGEEHELSGAAEKDLAVVLFRSPLGYLVSILTTWLLQALSGDWRLSEDMLCWSSCARVLRDGTTFSHRLLLPVGGVAR